MANIEAGFSVCSEPYNADKQWSRGGLQRPQAFSDTSNTEAYHRALVNDRMGLGFLLQPYSEIASNVGTVVVVTLDWVQLAGR